MLRLLAVALAVAAASLAVQVPASAAAPFQNTQSASFFRIKVGDFEVTALYDGGSKFDPKYLRADIKDLQAPLSKQLIDVDHIAGALSGFLINTGSKLILVDTGTGGLWGGASLGKLVSNLKESGYRPEQVDIILLTHLHADHVGGITSAQGIRVFPNAVVRMTKADSDFWLSEEIARKAPEDAKEFFKIARSSAQAYIAAKQWSPLVETDEIAPGVKPYPIPGHTPGHTGYEFTSKGQTMLVWGDVVHVAAVQLERPRISVVFDTDAAAAVLSREQLIPVLVEKGTLIAGAHMPFPALGRLRKEGSGYVWVPLPYSDTP